MLNRLKPKWGMLPVLVFLALWEVMARLGAVPGQIFFPAFSEVIGEFFPQSLACLDWLLYRFRMWTVGGSPYGMERTCR